MADNNTQETIKAFKDAVNMTPKELENWLETDDAKRVGQKDGSGESTGHASGGRILKLLDKKQADYSDDDLDHMQKVVS